MEIDVGAAPEQIREHDGSLWRPKPGATADFDAFVEAKSQLLVLWKEAGWNPWDKDRIAARQADAEEVWRQWERAEPDFKPMTDTQVSAYMAKLRRQSRAKAKAEDARWERDRARYNPEQEQARFALLEREAIRIGLERRLAECRDETVRPHMAPRWRAEEIADLGRQVEANAAKLDVLRARVGEPEEVVDERGRLPRDRRPLNLIGYRFERVRRVEELQAEVALLRASIAVASDRNAKNSLRNDLSLKEQHLASLLAVPRPEPAQMCADCETPQDQHVPGGSIHESRPCPRWPMHAARMDRFWTTLREASERLDGTKQESVQARPVPLATLPGDLPIAEVIARLSKLQAEHPDAVIRRGRANRWELWPKET